MYHSKVVVITWLVVFTAAMAAALIKSEIKAFLMILSGAAIMGAGIMASKTCNNEFGAIILSICLLASALVTLLGMIKVFKSEEDPG